MAVPVFGAGDEEGGFAVGVDGEEGGRGAEGCAGVGGGVARVQDEVVFYAELFEEPEDALGLRVLRWG